MKTQFDINKMIEIGKIQNELDFEKDHYGNKAAGILQQGKPAVISIESLVGDVFKRGFNTARNARYLEELFPAAKILITVREQLSMIDSLYRQYVNQGGTASFRKFMDMPPPKPVSFDPAFLCYDKVVERYRSLFGAGNVKVVLYEEIKAQPEKFISGVAAFLGVSPPGEIKIQQNVNRSLVGFSLNLLRLANYFLVSPMQPSNLVPGKSWHPLLRKFLQNNLATGHSGSVLDSSDKEYFSNFYKESNRRLRELTGLDVERYFYHL